MVEINDLFFLEDILKISELNPFETQKDVNNLNIKLNENTYFNDDLWDFSNRNTLDKKKYFYNYNFQNIHDNYKFYFKKTILDEFVIEKLKAGSVYSDYQHIRTFIFYLQDNSILFVNLVNIKILDDFFNNYLDIKERTKQVYKTSLKKFFKTMQSYGNSSAYNSIFDYLFKTDLSKKEMEIESGKTSIIPDSILNQMVSLALLDMKNLKLQPLDRLIACMIVIFSEIGLRIEEFEKLETNKLNICEIDDKRKLNYLEFKTFKTIHKKASGFKWTESYLSDKALLAYKTLEELSKEQRALKNSKYIYIINGYRKVKFTQYDIRMHIIRFFIKHYDKFNFNSLELSEKNQLKSYKVDKKFLRFLDKEDINLLGSEFYYISPHQFRVTVCTKLYKNNVPLEFIKKHLNHLDEDMTVHYIRHNQLNEKKKQVISIIKDRLNTNGTLLEVNAENVDNPDVKQELNNPVIKLNYEQINKFIVKNKFNINTDLDKILDILVFSSTPVTEFPEGFCARNALTNICERQNFLSSINDMYFCGVQIPNIDYLNITYKRYLDKSKIVKHNKQVAEENNIYQNEYDRELKSLRKYINERLIPELNFAKKEMDEIGLKNFKSKRPELSEIAENFDAILEKELPQWLI